MFHRFLHDPCPTDEYNLELDAINPQDDPRLLLVDLPPLPRCLPVLPLTEKPQNPIMDTIKRDIEARKIPSISHLPPELCLLVDSPTQTRQHTGNYNFWTDALTRNTGLRNKVLSWDRLRPSYPINASYTGFLSEQDDLVFASARYHMNLRLREPTMDLVHVTQNNVLNALKLTILGTSSVYHTWDPTTERFVQVGLREKMTRFLIIDGKDEVISQSVLSRFITIGTLLRRLEMFLAVLRTRSTNDRPTVHAYAHVLATIITFLRQALARSPPVNDPLSSQHTFSAIWMHYETYEEILVAMAELCGLDEERNPQDYFPFDPSPAKLLSSIYSHLDNHVERQSSHTITAIFAFILTHVSHEYHQQVSRSIGYGRDPIKNASRDTGSKLEKNPFDEDGEDEDEDSLFQDVNALGNTLPEFFPRSLTDILLPAQKSLVLLEKAQPNHPILCWMTKQKPITWFWSESLIDDAWKGTYPDISPGGSVVRGDVQPPMMAIGEDEFSLFRLFDLEPGATIGSPTSVTVGYANTESLKVFINQFPPALPPITPTLAHLTSLVFRPLVEHASMLSTALLTLFLSPPNTNQDTLNFRTHITLLRSYFLLAAPLFKSRLGAALFSDQGDCEYDYKPHGMPIRSLRRKVKSKEATTIDGKSSQAWAVGLSPSLLEREMWPPVGSDLSFFLRTVIVDSIENQDPADDPADDRNRVKSRVLEEAEYRLGFAIRDLPTGPGRDKWLNPLCIEALDFLYMDYKPPSPLEVIITPEILVKYQRLFSFILRLMRVEHALGSLFRMTRAKMKPLFPTLTSSRNQLLHFRFVTQSFVSNLSAYVFDTAIAGNFDPFLTRLSPPKDGHEAEFSDVFALARRHSVLLDDVLSACLLRSGQRAVGEVLRHALELILEFTIVVGDLHRGRMEEYQAAPLLEDISGKFFAGMATLTKVLKGLADKNGSLATAISLQGLQPGLEAVRRPVGGQDALYRLLIRLDLGDFWITNHR